MYKYKKPRCKCGNDLLFVKETLNKWKISSDGTTEDNSQWVDSDVTDKHLECKRYRCHRVYEIDYDENDNIIRGNEY